jgi:hypothetical protein
MKGGVVCSSTVVAVAKEKSGSVKDVTEKNGVHAKNG